MPARPAPFAGREAELETLRRTLGDAPGTVVLGSTVPGIGKTTLAVEFARRYRRDFDGIFWLSCECCTLAAIAGDLAFQLGLRLEGDAEDNCRDLRRFCAEKRCLIILDGVEEDASSQLIPRGRTSVLITTRRPDLAARFSGCPMELAGQAAIVQPAIAAAEGDELSLLCAMALCAPSGCRLALAADIAGLDEAAALHALDGLRSRALVCELDANRRFYGAPAVVRGALQSRLPDGARRHARAVREDRDPDLPNIRKALEWALAQPGDEEAWTLACELSRRALTVTQAAGRLAETFEVMEQLSHAAEKRNDRRVLEDCSWEQVWLLEKWDRLDEARALHCERKSAYSDQMFFDF